MNKTYALIRVSSDKQDFNSQMEGIRNYCKQNNIEWQWIRIFTVFGEKQTGGLIKLAIEKCLNGEKSFDTTPGEQKYSTSVPLKFGTI